jgi:TolA-binding protein
MGEAALDQGNTEEALGYFRRAADDYRTTETAPVALYAIGFTQVKENEYDAAAEAFELLGARYPESSYARNVGLALAEVYYELNDYQRSIDEIRKRLPDLEPEARERAEFLLAESYNQLRDSENAIIQYQRFTESNPNSPYYRRALYGLAWNYYFEDQHQWAVERFALVRDNQRDDLAARSTYYEAVNQKLARQPDASIELLEEFLDRWPDHELSPQAKFELAIAYYEQRRWEEAYKIFSNIVDRHLETDLAGQALFYRGNAAIATGDFDVALQNFERAISLDAAPAELKDEVRFQRAWLQYRSGSYQDAVRSFADLHREAPRTERGSEALFW